MFYINKHVRFGGQSRRREKHVAMQKYLVILHCNKTPNPGVTTMTNTTAEINAFLENSRKLAEPVARFQELAARTTERFARYGYEVAGDFLNLGIASLYATSQSKDLPELLKKQSELANQYYEKQTLRSQDLLKIAGETQATVTQWIDQTSTEFTQRAKTAKAA